MVVKTVKQLNADNDNEIAKTFFVSIINSTNVLKSERKKHRQNKTAF